MKLNHICDGVDPTQRLEQICICVEEPWTEERLLYDSSLMVRFLEVWIGETEE
jgi:hypothetical protein